MDKQKLWEIFQEKMIDSKKAEKIQEGNPIHLDDLDCMALQVSTSGVTLNSFNEEMLASRWPN